MTNWPTAPLIRIARGSADGYELKDVVAIKGNAVNAYRGYGLHLVEGWDGDEIEEWEEVEAVPTAALKRLRDVCLGVELPSAQFAAIQQVTSCLPAGKPSGLDQAVVKVKDLGETPLILKGFPQEYDLALLLESLAALQVAVRKGQTLAKIVLVCTTWVDFLSLSDDSLDHVRKLAESDSDRAEFTDMVRIAGDIASNIADGAIGQQKRSLLAVAQCALAWLAELIEKEEA